MMLSGSGCHPLKPNSVLMRQRQRLCQILRSVFPTLKCPDSKCKLRSMQTAKPRERCYFQMVMALGSSSKTKSTGPPHLGLLWVCNKMGASLISCHYCSKTNHHQPVPAIAFSDNTGQSIADLFNKQLKIYVTPTDYFTTKFRQIFTKTQIKFTQAKYARKWLGKPDMSFWPQQLNFALWCATTGCGVSREMLFSNSSLQLSDQVRTFYQFHVYYTTRKILYEMGGIQSKNALPDDPAFNQKNNPYDVASYKRICAEFGVDPSTDFRFTYGQNHGLGYVNIMYSDGPFAQKKWQYPPADLSNPSSQRLAGDSGTTTNNTIAFIRNDQGADTQFEHFVPAQTSGLTLNGLGRINQSIMAFGYCILGSQANTRSSILGNLGTARNTQTDFLVLIEDSIKTLNVSNGPVKYQDAIQATKVRLNLAVARGVLLLPARMIINTESIVGYNNNLRRSTDDMKLGVNNQVNQDTKKASLKLMEGGPSKVNPPNSHPSNPIHKQATEAQGIAKPTRHTRHTHTKATHPPHPKSQRNLSHNPRQSLRLLTHIT